MASEVEICNLALSHIGAFRISSLNEPTKESRQCKLLYGPARDSVLEEHDWAFARKEQTLALLPDTYSGWDFAYAYPSDSIAPRFIYNPATGETQTRWDINTLSYMQKEKIEYELRVNENKDQNILLTNQDNAILIYTAAVTSPPLFTKMFIDALSWRLAADLAISMKADKNMEIQMRERYLFKISSARVSISNAENKKPEEYNTFVEARQ